MSAGPRIAVVALAVGCVAGMGLGWALWRPKTVRETPAPAVRQADGSLILERRPETTARPAQQIPRGAIVERVVKVTVQPRALAALPAIPGSAPAGVVGPVAVTPQSPCPPVRVDLSLIRFQDFTRRVIASSPDGLVIGGLDVPMEPSGNPGPQLTRAAGITWERTWDGRTAWGGFFDQDFGPIRTGVEVYKMQMQPGIRADIGFKSKLGIRF